MASKRVSMQQIADAVGVSKYAVSKALAGQGGVSPQTREKIIAMAANLGYFLQRKPAVVRDKSTVSGKSEANERRTVAVLMPGVRQQSSFWSIVIEGIAEALAGQGLAMLIITEQSAEEFGRVLRPEMLLGLIGVGEISSSMLLEVRRLGVPFVLTDHEDQLVPADSVFAANMDSMSQMTRHLLALGHQSFWFLGDIRFSRSFYDRWTGFRKALEEEGISVHSISDKLPLAGKADEDNILLLNQYVDEYMQQETLLPTAWVCANDEIALVALKVLHAREIRVPEQISVTGFDNIEESGRYPVPLTTVHIAKDRLGQRAVMALLERIRHPDRGMEKISLVCELVLRSSTGPPPPFNLNMC